MPSGTFTASAVVSDGTAIPHYRDRDHTGFESDENIELDEVIGPWGEGTSLHAVLDELWALVTT